QKEFGSPARRAVAREAVRQSMVLLKNEGKLLPLSLTARRIHVSGRGADDLGMQCGGWTVDWQGKRGAVTTGGTTILQALRQAAGKDTLITDSKDQPDATGADLALVVVGEDPYAESKGDRSDLTLSAEDTAAVSAAKATG
ncbi:glycoside hydrolase family 3 C-terminal domain-containing protein, partial [Bradyrhizobium sp. NBAIM08]|nr:glycoside hydrolase family 3 C-terminal domain-containing protein [Bradyrhizobium sp. NBAIM08]